MGKLVGRSCIHVEPKILYETVNRFENQSSLLDIGTFEAWDIGDRTLKANVSIDIYKRLHLQYNMYIV